MMHLSQAAQAVAGKRLGADVEFSAVSTDTRTIGQGALFVALRGERFDGHAFVPAARAAGAVAAMVDEAGAAAAGEPALVVGDTRQSLGALAAAWRAKIACPLVGVVGSNGKTTVKEMVAAILRLHYGDAAVLATEGNLNNDIGLPLTLLRLRGSHRAGVVEIGMNHPGETAVLGALARPTIGLINNAQREHQEFMQSVEEVAHEHASLLANVRQGGQAVINADDEFAAVWRKAAADAGLAMRDFALDHPAAVTARCGLAEFSSDIALRSPEGEVRFTLPLAGVHNVRNAVAAVAAATAAGATLASAATALTRFGGVRGRQQRKRSQAGATVIDDTYNANPESVRAAIDVLKRFAGETTLVLGDMGEVGDHGEAFHREIGEYAREARLGALLGFGELTRHAVAAFGAGGLHADSLETLLRQVRERDRAGATLLVKGSRFMRMERVVDALTGTSETH
jgi:UDP-N-acetylmuramoyl-tripeptide--D-alanyl-D-alanine ligase